MMSRDSRMLAGILLVVLPSVMYGGLTLLTVLSKARLVTHTPVYPFVDDTSSSVLP